MKRNLILVSILAALLTFTYFFEEVSIQETRIQKELKESLYDVVELGELKSVQFPSYTLNILENGKVNVNNFPADQTRANKILAHLSHLKLRQILTDEEVEKVGRESFVADSKNTVQFHFANDIISLTLGQKQNFSQYFYMIFKKNNEAEKIVVVDDTLVENALVQKEGYERSDHKYRRIQSLFWMPVEMVYDASIFSKIEFPKVDKIELRASGKRPVIFGIKDISMVPALPPGLRFHFDHFNKFVNELKDASGKRVIPKAKRDDLKNAQSTIVINDDLDITLYRMYQGNIGSYIHIGGTDYVVELDPKFDNFFFYPWQKFIYKSFSKEDAPKAFSIGKGQFKLDIKVDFINKGFVSNQNVNQLELQKLFSLIRSDANHFTVTKAKTPKNYKMEISFEGNSYYFDETSSEITLINPKNGIKLHYKKSSTPYRLDPKKYLR